jgi:mono/diheme cytochrome c family protein
MPASRHLFRPQEGRPTPTPEAVDLVAYLQVIGRARRDIWAEWRRRDPAVPEPPPAGAAMARRGDELYRRHCAPCHGQGGDGRGEAAGFFTFPPRDFVAGRYRFKSTPPGQPPSDADLYRSISLGTGTGSAMPAFYWMDEGDRWALVLRVKEFSPALRATPLSVPREGSERRRLEAPGGSGAPGNAAGETEREGRRLWDGLGCAACHGPSGAGMTRKEAGTEWSDGAGVIVPRSGDLTHACALRAGASDQAIERALIVGVGEAMPSFADDLRDASKRRALVSFIVSLQGGAQAERDPR